MCINFFLIVHALKFNKLVMYIACLGIIWPQPEMTGKTDNEPSYAVQVHYKGSQLIKATRSDGKNTICKISINPFCKKNVF